MKKDAAIRIITECAKLYQNNLENKNLLFVFGDKLKAEYFEAVFLPKHYLHLTGVVINKTKPLGSSVFYKMCLDGKLSPSSFELTDNGTTELKLSILSQIMKIHKTAKMIGEYTYSKSLLVTEKVAGNVNACMGFVRDDAFYVPNTALKEDIRDITQRPQKRVLATFSKEITAPTYTTLAYIAEGIYLDNLMPQNSLADKIDFENIKAEFSIPYTPVQLPE